MKPSTQKSLRTVALGNAIHHEGGNYGARLAMEANAQGVPVSVLCAICEQETGFANVFGHDRKANGRPSGIPKRWMGTNVTKSKYQWYKIRRRFLGAQGVGPFQLTNPDFQDEADRDGGCWVVSVNIATATRILADLFAKYRNWKAVYAVYNSGNTTSQQGRVYAGEVHARQQKWHRVLGGV